MKHALLVLAALGTACCSPKDAESPAAKPGGASLGSSAPRAEDSRTDAGPKATPPSLGESIEYWDGETRRKLWLSEDLVAEFDPSDAGRDSILREDPSASEVEQPQPSVRIWRLAGPLRGDAFARRAGSVATRISPVLHEGPSPGLPMRALPGGVVATFPREWDRTRIDAWLADRGLAVRGEAVAEAANMFLVGTPAGLESVKIADRLREEGVLVDVAPNFWLQNVAR